MSTSANKKSINDLGENNSPLAPAVPILQDLVARVEALESKKTATRRIKKAAKNGKAAK